MDIEIDGKATTKFVKVLSGFYETFIISATDTEATLSSPDSRIRLTIPSDTMENGSVQLRCEDLLDMEIAGRGMSTISIAREGNFIKMEHVETANTKTLPLLPLPMSEPIDFEVFVTRVNVPTKNFLASLDTIKGLSLPMAWNLHHKPPYALVSDSESVVAIGTNHYAGMRIELLREPCSTFTTLLNTEDIEPWRTHFSSAKPTTIAHHNDTTLLTNGKFELLLNDSSVLPPYNLEVLKTYLQPMDTVTDQPHISIESMLTTVSDAEPKDDFVSLTQYPVSKMQASKVLKQLEGEAKTSTNKLFFYIDGVTKKQSLKTTVMLPLTQEETE